MDELDGAVDQHMTQCLELAATALEMVTRDPPYTEHVATLRDLVDRIEVSAVALTSQTGVTWDAMAANFGVRRQSLHRRLRRPATKWLAEAGRPLSSDEVAGRSRTWRYLLRRLGMAQEPLTGTTYLGGGPEALDRTRARLKKERLRAIRSQQAAVRERSSIRSKDD